MRIRTIALALPLVVGGAACSTTSSQRTQAAGPPPVAATEREGNAPQNRPENQPGSGVGATAPGQPSGTAVNGSAMGGDTSAPGTQATPGTSGTGAMASDDLKAHSDDEVISGTISKVSRRSLTISSGDGNERTLQLVPQTSVMVNGQEAQTADLQEGLPVRASFSTVEDREVAVDVRAGSAANGQGGATGAEPSGTSAFPGTPGAGPTPGPGGGGPQNSDQPAPSHLPKRN